MLDIIMEDIDNSLEFIYGSDGKPMYVNDKSKQDYIIPNDKPIYINGILQGYYN